MTAREIYEYGLIHQNKVEAPSLEMEQYNFFINDAINAVLNKTYNFFNLDQIRTDQLQTLHRSVAVDINGTVGTPSVVTGDVTQMYNTPTIPIIPTSRGIKFLLPINYHHLLSCTVFYRSTTNQKWCAENEVIDYTVKRATSDMLAAIRNNHYNMPSFKTPYYHITDNPAANSFLVNSNNKPGVNNAEIEIITGNRHRTFEFSRIEIDYLKEPEKIILTYEQAYDDIIPGSPQDTSQVLEFPTFMCYTIASEFAARIATNAGDLNRAGAIATLANTIAPPAGMGGGQ